jgi:hypothetical protein
MMLGYKEYSAGSNQQGMIMDLVWPGFALLRIGYKGRLM